MSKESDELLEAEQAVQELLSELEKLKRQIGGYSDAREALNHVSQKLGELIQQTQTLTEGTHRAITVLTKIGTPEILNAIKELAMSLTSLAVQIDQSLKKQAIEAENRIKQLNSKINANIFISSCSLIVTVAIIASLFLGIPKIF
jgi:ElaB/YqjD/DUF883 family membrane-anchored ribosome-binding protein